jgi:hypothetical protein
MRRILVLSLIAAGMGVAALAASASATVIASCNSGATLGAGVPFPAGTLPPKVEEQVGSELTTGPSCSTSAAITTACAFKQCRATVSVAALGGIIYGRVQTTSQNGQEVFYPAADCGPVVAGPRLPSGCQASLYFTNSYFAYASCTMEGVAAVYPGLSCVVEAPPFE